MTVRFYTNVIQYGNNILFRGYNEGKRVQMKTSFAPSFFVRSKEKNAKYQSIYGDAAEKITFSEINEAKDYLKRYKDVEGFPIFGNSNFGYQFINENYPGEIHYDINQMSVWTIDIETTTEYGFPNVQEAKEQVLLITAMKLSTKETKTFGFRHIEQVEGTTYLQSNDEYSMLRAFVEWFEQESPDILTGWNIELFDVPYLVRRIARVLGEAYVKRLSPWGIVREREVHAKNRTQLAYQIFGVSIIDYLDLYRKFTYGAQESYTLDHIAKVELGVGKLDHSEYSSFKEFYTKNFTKFTQYNVVDVKRVDQLEDKMRLLELILTMAYDAKSNYNDVFSSVRTWDCILYNYLLTKNIVVPQRDEGNEGRAIEGAFVKEPKPGMYKWVVSIDAASLYPSIIMQYNMSPEKLVEDHVQTTVDALVRGEFPEFPSVYSLAANGHMFKRDAQGIFPQIVSTKFNERKRNKALMLKAQQMYENTKDPKYLKDVSRYNNIQMAMKIQLNALFGVMSNEYFRLYDSRVSEGITMTGQFIIRKIGDAINQYLNGLMKTEGVDYAFYQDTDSCYITFGPVVDKFFKDKSTTAIVDILDKICKEKIDAVLKKACKEIADKTNAFEQKIDFKREVIADRGFWVAKKRYALNVYDSEGVRYKEPKLKVLGLEIVRSSTPEVVREYLRQAVGLVLTKTDKDVRLFVKEAEKEFMSRPVEEISFPRSVNGLGIYESQSSIYSKGTPIHVRGSLLYNHYRKELGLEQELEEIYEGDKIRFVMLKVPNTIRENIIAFKGDFPEKIIPRSVVDYELMFQKTFLDPLDSIMKAVSWEVRETASLEGLFE